MMSIRAVLVIFPCLLLPCLTSGASIQGKKFVVTTTLRGEPYLSLKPDHAGQTGNDKYEGYIMDLLDELSSKLQCKFGIQMVADNKYGTYDPATGKWTGMVGEVISGAADMAVVDMSITAKREEAVDFTVPFMHLGITALYKQSRSQRIPVSVDDLLNQNIRLGVYGYGSTFTFFKESSIPTYQKIFKKMEGKADVLTTSNSEGVKKVIDSDGDFAYFLESPAAEYQVSKNCGLTMVGGLLNTNGHGIALPQGSPYREAFNIALLQLREDGTLDKMKMKWWNKEKAICKDKNDWFQNVWNLVASL